MQVARFLSVVGGPANRDRIGIQVRELIKNEGGSGQVPPHQSGCSFPDPMVFNTSYTTRVVWCGSGVGVGKWGWNGDCSSPHLISSKLL